MAKSFIIPHVVPVFPGYDTVFNQSEAAVLGRLIVPDAVIDNQISVYRNGECVDRVSHRIRIENGAVVEGALGGVRVKSDEADELPGYLHSNMISSDESEIFSTHSPVTLYTTYVPLNGGKPFFSNGAPRYSEPRVINQIREFGEFCDTYPNVIVDREKGYGFSLFLINPYSKAIVMTVATQGSEKVAKTRIDPQSSKILDLSEALLGNGSRWAGQIQIKANNRLISFVLRHSLENPKQITDFDHMDPFRGEPTHLPATQLMRIKTADLLEEKLGISRPN